MDWNNFLIFFTQKWLIPQTEEEAQKAQIKQNENSKWWTEENENYIDLV